MKQLLKIQKNALELGAKFVKAGGCLVYSTCTLNPKENEEQVNKFLEKHPEFTLFDAERKIPKRFVENGFIKTIPFRDRIDGAFAARLQKEEE